MDYLNKTKKYLSLTFFTLFNLLASNALAACNSSAPGTVNDAGFLKGLPCDRPVSDIWVIITVTKNAIATFVLPAVGTLFLIMFIYGGIIYISSAGQPDRIKKGKDTLTAAIIGLFLIVLSEVLVGILTTAIGGQIR